MTSTDTKLKAVGHTAGPWEANDFSEGEYGFAVVSSETKETVAYAVLSITDLDNQDTSRAEANANILAASLDLKEALEDLLHAVCGEVGFANAVRTHSGFAYPWHTLDDAEEKARAAIAKAEGRAS